MEDQILDVVDPAEVVVDPAEEVNNREEGVINSLKAEEEEEDKGEEGVQVKARKRLDAERPILTGLILDPMRPKHNQQRVMFGLVMKVILEQNHFSVQYKRPIRLFQKMTLVQKFTNM